MWWKITGGHISKNNKRGSCVHVAASMGGHNGEEMEEKEILDEEDTNQSHTIHLPNDDE